MQLTTIFYHVDNFCKLFEKEFKIRVLSSGKNLRKRKSMLSLSDVMTIIIYYQYSGYKTFKDYYTRNTELNSAFHNLPSYNRFIELQQKISTPLMIFTKLQMPDNEEKIFFIDSFPLAVSHPKRIPSHKTFHGLAERGHTSVGWFYGFKVHIVINSKGEIFDFTITPGNVADNNADVLKKITKKIDGKVYGDKGYLLNPELFKKLLSQGVHLVTKVRKNMKKRYISVSDEMILKKRGVIESVIAVLKEDLNIEHSRYRSPISLFINACSALAAYCFREKKPSIYKKGLQPLHS